MEPNEMVWQETSMDGRRELRNPRVAGEVIVVEPTRKRGILTGYRVKRTIEEVRRTGEGASEDAPG